MTEKRYFKREWEEEYYIFDSNTISESDFEEKLEYEDYKAFEDCMMGDEVVDRLNELNDENDVLKQQLKTKYIVNKQYEELQKVKEENEQLKQFQDSVFSWIDMHLQRLPTLRDDEFESDNEFADPSLYSGAIQILETMKRELKEELQE